MMPDKRRRNKEEGFTLLEVLFAICILTFGLLAVGSMQIASIRGNHFAGKVSDGIYVACDKMEDLMSLPYGDADLAPAPAGSPHIDPAPPAGYGVSWTVVADSPVASTKTVTVTVTWQERGAQRTSSVQQIIPRII